jgi:heme oxygenase
LTVATALRSATRQAHQRLEQRLDIKSRFSTLPAYRAHLEGTWGFYAALEGCLSRESFGGGLPDYEMRRKLPLLTQDLLALGASEPQILALERCPALPACQDPGSAFGCLYVIEGATLGGQTLAPMVQKKLGMTDRGVRFLSSYGEEVMPMWRTFLSSLEACCALPETQASSERAAVETFAVLERWLCERSA